MGGRALDERLGSGTQAVRLRDRDAPARWRRIVCSELKMDEPWLRPASGEVQEAGMSVTFHQPGTKRIQVRLQGGGHLGIQRATVRLT